jgi:hypothetical protein
VFFLLILFCAQIIDISILFDHGFNLHSTVLSEDMANDGYEDIVNIDISSVVIEQMSEKHVGIPQLGCSISRL